MYSFSTKVSGSYDEVLPKVVEALKSEGFGIITEIDIRETMKKKLGIDKLPYKILGACNPGLANQALEADSDIGLLLPCNVVVREEQDGSVTVAFMDPVAVLNLTDKSEIEQLAKDVRSKLERVRDML
ncbi:MAG TPA: DUF302 domain-containing protein [Gammaproteobacteria bacterium]|nr:DUF302 domain-containing protein [Gammaproteobacteria bacterium]